MSFANIKTKSDKSEESSDTAPPPRSAPRNASDDLMGLPMEPTGLEGGGNFYTFISYKILTIYDLLLTMLISNDLK